MRNNTIIWQLFRPCSDCERNTIGLIRQDLRNLDEREDGVGGRAWSLQVSVMVSKDMTVG